VKPLRVIGGCVAAVLLAFSPWLPASAPFAGVANAQDDPHCLKGDVEIGRDDNFLYCSRLPCGQLGDQLKRDQQAARTQQRADELNSRELENWGRENDKAQKAALKHATDFLVESVAAGIGDHFEEKLGALERNVSRRAATGETWSTKLQKVRDFEQKATRLEATIDGIKLAQYPGKNAAELWTVVQERTADGASQASRLAEVYQKMRSDPELAALMREQGFNFAADTLKVFLASQAQKTLDLGGFLVNYGYDASAWGVSRARILQGVTNGDKILHATCVLDKQLKITVRNQGVCRGVYPAENAPDPNEIRCNAPR